MNLTFSNLAFQCSSRFVISSIQWERTCITPAVVALKVIASPLKSIPVDAILDLGNIFEGVGVAARSSFSSSIKCTIGMRIKIFAMKHFRMLIFTFAIFILVSCLFRWQTPVKIHTRGVYWQIKTKFLINLANRNFSYITSNLSLEFDNKNFVFWKLFGLLFCSTHITSVSLTHPLCKAHILSKFLTKLIDFQLFPHCQHPVFVINPAQK